MKAVILAGGFGTRISEETHLKPKPMIEIGGKPILWHIMKRYSAYGINEFVICSGYMGNVIKDYFKKKHEDWEVNVLDTGKNTMTGGRLKRVKKYIKNETFCFTYGDSLNNANISNIIKFHKDKGKLATVTACHPPEKYGILKIERDMVVSFEEKPEKNNEWVNAGYFVLEPQIFELIKDDSTVWEKEPMKQLISKNQFSAFKHKGFYKSMDTISDRNFLEKLWNNDNAEWKNWK
ncbi:glucose-1-phosphate cytidylyltransferase [Nitrosopumilus ureiphilus]|uniref:Glucose-1-phosphate cytidylyltransferase n=1 Tax=Nitrosopumilus ureiphilus TaxID=1470067 RepID=A0A7D5R0K7_9ARCH|nr:glucose-1-phosphate cytidylyltransferase [Nitrosopumilus ureiphilus]QLH05796.1 glucose-1-phosphate cytidylyltransferase [Nitrosopumilus ureiphilus]